MVNQEKGFSGVKAMLSRDQMKQIKGGFAVSGCGSGCSGTCTFTSGDCKGKSGTCGANSSGTCLCAGAC